MNDVTTQDTAEVPRAASRGRWRLIVAAVSIVIATAGVAAVFSLVHRDAASAKSVVATLRVPGRPSWITQTPAGLWLVLNSPQDAGFGSSSSLVRINLGTGSVERTVKLPGEPGSAIFTGQLLWVTDAIDGWWGPGALVALDPETGAVVRRVPIPAGGLGQLALGAGSMWLLLERPGTVLRLDPATGHQIGAPIRFGSGTGQSVGIGFGDGAIWTNDSPNGDVVRIDPSRGAVARVHVGGFPVGIAFAAGNVWVANRGDGAVDRVDPRMLRLIGKPIHVGSNPTWIAPLAGSVWVANQDDGTVTRISATTGRKIGSAIRVAAPRSGDAAVQDVAAIDGSLWVTSMTEGSLSRIDPSR